MAVTLTKERFLSSDGKTQVSYKCWREDEKAPKAVFQLVHGMAEYILRYDGFARYLAAEGFAVYGHDHLGHGDTAACKEDLGYFAPKDGYRLLAEDAHTLTGIIRKENPGVPVFLLGHSMGSFVVRLYAAQYGGDIDGLVIMGTSGSNPAAGAGIALINILSRFQGERHRSGLINNIAFGSYSKQFGKDADPFAWLSVNEDNVARYKADDLCGYLFTLSAYRDLFNVLKTVNEKDWAPSLRKDLPVLVISGEEDPVGANGKGVREVYDALCAAGVKDVTLQLEAGMRHEILNEDNKEKIYGDIAAWALQRMA